VNFDDLDYGRDLPIDLNALDLEWLKQPVLFMKYSEACVEAEKVAKKAEEDVKITRSELIKKISRKAAKEGSKTPTGQAIEAAYRTDPEYIEAKEAFIEAEAEAALLKSAVFAFQQRKSALENFVILHGQQYFAGPKVPRIIDQEAVKEVRRELTPMKERMNKKGKRSRRTR